MTQAQDTDDYIVTAIRRLRTAGITGSIYVAVNCGSYSYGTKPNELTVTHTLKVDLDGNEINLKGNNFDDLVDSILAHFKVMNNSKPQTYVPMLEVPLVDEVEIAEFTPVDLDDEVLF